MKVVVQNGVRHALSRQDAEAMVQLFPSSWGKAVKSITLYQTNEGRVSVGYHSKEKAIGLYWPREANQLHSKSSAIDELLIAMAAVVDKGDLPDKLSESRRTKYLNDTVEIRERCAQVVDV